METDSLKSDQQLPQAEEFLGERGAALNVFFFKQGMGS
jgi:hypothetical protein